MEVTALELEFEPGQELPVGKNAVVLVVTGVLIVSSCCWEEPCWLACANGCPAWPAAGAEVGVVRERRDGVGSTPVGVGVRRSEGVLSRESEVDPDMASFKPAAEGVSGTEGDGDRLRLVGLLVFDGDPDPASWSAEVLQLESGVQEKDGFAKVRDLKFLLETLVPLELVTTVLFLAGGGNEKIGFGATVTTGVTRLPLDGYATEDGVGKAGRNAGKDGKAAEEGVWGKGGSCNKGDLEDAVEKEGVVRKPLLW